MNRSTSPAAAPADSLAADPAAPPSTPAAPVADGPGFDRLGLPPAVLENLQRLGFTAMTPIQAQSLPLSLAGADLIAQAKTGSGKTVAFGLPLLQRVDTRRFDVQALVLCPTRELADQVAQELRRLARAEDNVKVLVLTGGATMRPQLASLAHGAHVIVGTPGRIKDHLERGSLSLGAVGTVVLDEADRMLDMGFADEINEVLRHAPAPGKRQTLLFSATYPEDVGRLSARHLKDPKTVTVAERHDPVVIRQRFYEVEDTQRLHAVGQLLAAFRPASTIAFCNTKQQCRDLAAVLAAQGIEALELHGDLEQRDRDQVLIRFANRSASVLVATDVAARGLDISGLDAVINVDVSQDPEAHVHRVGRTGRAGATGEAWTLASMDEMGRVGRIELLQGRASEWEPLSGLTLAPGGPLRPPMVTIQILGGRKEKIRRGDVLGALTKDIGLPGEAVGRIDVNDFATYVAVRREDAPKALKGLQNGKVKGKSVKARTL